MRNTIFWTSGFTSTALMGLATVLALGCATSTCAAVGSRKGLNLIMRFMASVTHRCAR